MKCELCESRSALRQGPIENLGNAKIKTWITQFSETVSSRTLHMDAVYSISGFLL